MWTLNRDHPDIERIERTGYGSQYNDETPLCPVCGAECDDIYYDRNGEIFGCDRCVKRKDAWEWLDEGRMNE